MASRDREVPLTAEQQDNLIVYKASPTLRAFHACELPVRGVMGPIGSGKSSACVMEIYRRAKSQAPYRGVRRSRWAVIRNSYPELRDTTIVTWQQWIPERICHINWSPPMRGHMRMPLQDGSLIDMEVLFLALDRPEDVHKLKSLELTGAWVNEAVEVPKAVITHLRSRVGRYPPKRQGGHTWSGVIMDTNPPHDGHWYYKLAEEIMPEDHAFFRQPPAILRLPVKRYGDPPQYVANMGQGQYPAAENVDNHTEGYGYWLKLVPGAEEEWIKVFLQGQYGVVMSGRPVYPEYNDDIHCARSNFEIMRGLPIYAGWDFGLTPAVVFAQLNPKGQMMVVDEICAQDIGLRWFIEEAVKPHIKNYYQNMKMVSISDPAGNSRGEQSELTCLQILEESGIPTEMARTNEFTARRESVALLLRRMSRDGSPGFLLAPRCKVLRRGFLGGYRYRQIRTMMGERFANSPEKNEFSHPQDALQYIALELAEITPTIDRTANFERPPNDRSFQDTQPRDIGAWT